MLEYLKRNGQFAVMLLIWLAAGFVHSMAGVAVVTVSILLLKKKEMYSELISGFILILILSDSFKPALHFAKEVKIIYLILLTLFYFFDRKSFKKQDSFFPPFIPFLVWACFQIMRGPEFGVAVQKTISYGLIFLIGPAYSIKLFTDKGTIFIKDHVFLMSFMLAIGLLLFVVANNQVVVGDRYSGVMGNPNAIGLFCMLFFMLIYSAQIKFPGLFTKNEQVLLYGLIAVSVLLSGSRNTIISIGIFLFFSRFYKLSPLLGTAIVILTAIVYQLVVSNLTEILTSLGLAKAMRADTLESGSGRLVAWAWAWKFINADIKNFFLGMGFGFDEYYFIISHHILSKLGHIGGVHNSYLAIWINTGIIGLILWFAAFLRTIIKAIPKAYTALPFMYAILFSAFFEAWLMGSLNPYTITFLFVLCIIYTDSNSFADRKPQTSVLAAEPAAPTALK
ncbi:MAG: O-antigen ligase family protein [Bacteroidetes bacterium]|nr:O-antigen ligase family protein [Bacteroidota bacterium]